MLPLVPSSYFFKTYPVLFFLLTGKGHYFISIALCKAMPKWHGETWEVPLWHGLVGKQWDMGL